MIDSIENYTKTSSQDKSESRYSRYKNLLILRMPNNEACLETYEHVNVPETNKDLIYRVSPGEEGRLDLIAYRFYSNPLLWWIIAEANGIINPFSISGGDVIRIPSRDSVFGYKGLVS